MKTSTHHAVLSESSQKGRKKLGLTIAKVKAIPELQHISDEQAKEFIQSLRSFAKLCYCYVSKRFPELTQPIQKTL